MTDLRDTEDRNGLTDPPVDPVGVSRPGRGRIVLPLAAIAVLVSMAAIVIGVHLRSSNAPPQIVAPSPQAQVATPLPAELPQTKAALCKEFVHINYRAVTQADIDELKGNSCIWKLDLDGATLTDDQMSQIAFAVPYVHTLDISYSRGLSRIGYATIANMAGLRALDVGDTTFGDDDLVPLGRLSHLNELDLRRTHVTDASAPWLAKLDSLERLWLNEDDVGDDVTGAIALLTNLWDVDLTKTRLSNVGLARLASSLPKLAFLQIGGTAVTGDGLPVLESVPGLLGLELQDDAVNGDSLVVVEKMHSLLRLNLSRTKIVGGDLVHLRGLSDMKRLFLNGIPVTDADMQVVSGLVNIAELEIDNTAVTDTGVAALVKMPNLDFLSLRNNGGITESSVKLLLTAPELLFVNVRGTQINQEGDFGKLKIRSY